MGETLSSERRGRDIDIASWRGRFAYRILLRPPCARSLGEKWEPLRKETDSLLDLERLGELDRA